MMTTELSETEIKQYIHLIRGQRVMLDSTLAKFYQVENRSLKRAVRRNNSRFPDDFVFGLTEEETQTLLCQFGTAKTLMDERRGGNRFSPYAFTEGGVACFQVW